MFDKKSLIGRTIAVDNDTWTISGAGAIDGDKIYLNLVSQTRGDQQANGWNPRQIGDWVHLVNLPN